MDTGNTSVDHLKYSILLSAFKKRASLYNTSIQGSTSAITNLDGEVGIGSGSSAVESQTKQLNIVLPAESFIKNLLVNICDAENQTDSLEAVLWLCIHIQRAPFLRVKDHEHYLSMLFGVKKALKSASVNHAHQTVLNRVLVTVANCACQDLKFDLQAALVQFLNIDDIGDWKKHLETLKVKVINAISPYLMHRIYGWSSSDTIYLTEDHAILEEVLSSVSARNSEEVFEVASGSKLQATEDTKEVDTAELILEALILHEGSHCIARKRAMETAKDPTLYSTQISVSKISDSMKLSVSCDFVRNCVPETGRVAESILLGGFLDLDSLWASREMYGGLLVKPRPIPLHGLCSACFKDMAVTGLPLTDPKSVSEMGFSCCSEVITFM